jgi:hypothetical protein
LLPAFPLQLLRFGAHVGVDFTAPVFLTSWARQARLTLRYAVRTSLIAKAMV